MSQMCHSHRPCHTQWSCHSRSSIGCRIIIIGSIGGTWSRGSWILRFTRWAFSRASAHVIPRSTGPGVKPFLFPSSDYAAISLLRKLGAHLAYPTRNHQKNFAAPASMKPESFLDIVDTECWTMWSCHERRFWMVPFCESGLVRPGKL